MTPLAEEKRSCSLLGKGEVCFAPNAVAAWRWCNLFGVQVSEGSWGQSPAHRLLQTLDRTFRAFARQRRCWSAGEYRDSKHEWDIRVKHGRREFQGPPSSGQRLRLALPRSRRRK